MKALTTAIYGKLSGSSLATYVSDRLYKGESPEQTDYPYVVYGIIGGHPEYTMSEVFENPTCQFDLFSADVSSTEVENMFSALISLYDEISLSPTSETVLNMTRTNYNLIREEHTLPNGLQKVWHYSIDYDIYLKRS